MSDDQLVEWLEDNGGVSTVEASRRLGWGRHNARYRLECLYLDGKAVRSVGGQGTPTYWWSFNDDEPGVIPERPVELV